MKDLFGFLKRRGRVAGLQSPVTLKPLGGGAHRIEREHRVNRCPHCEWDEATEGNPIIRVERVIVDYHLPDGSVDTRVEHINRLMGPTMLCLNCGRPWASSESRGAYKVMQKAREEAEARVRGAVASGGSGGGGGGGRSPQGRSVHRTTPGFPDDMVGPPDEPVLP